MEELQRIITQDFVYEVHEFKDDRGVLIFIKFGNEGKKNEYWVLRMKASEDETFLYLLEERLDTGLD